MGFLHLRQAGHRHPDRPCLHVDPRHDHRAEPAPREVPPDLRGLGVRPHGPYQPVRYVPLHVVPPDARPVHREPVLLHHRPLPEDAEGGAEPEDEARRRPRKIAVALGPVEAEGDPFGVGGEIRGGALRFLREAERHRGRGRGAPVRGDRCRLPVRRLRDPSLHHHHLHRGDRRQRRRLQGVREHPRRGGGSRKSPSGGGSGFRTSDSRSGATRSASRRTRAASPRRTNPTSASSRGGGKWPGRRSW